jgi:hypothetical protein
MLAGTAVRHPCPGPGDAGSGSDEERTASAQAPQTVNENVRAVTQRADTSRMW